MDFLPSIEPPDTQGTNIAGSLISVWDVHIKQSRTIIKSSKKKLSIKAEKFEFRHVHEYRFRDAEI